MNLTNEMLREVMTPEQMDDYDLRWEVLQQESPAGTMAWPEWLDPWMTPVIVTPLIVEILGESATWCGEVDGLSVYRAA